MLEEATTYGYWALINYGPPLVVDRRPLQLLGRPGVARACNPYASRGKARLQRAGANTRSGLPLGPDQTITLGQRIRRNHPRMPTIRTVNVARALPIIILLVAIVVTALIIGLVLRVGARFFDCDTRSTQPVPCVDQGHQPKLVTKVSPQPCRTEPSEATAPAGDLPRATPRKLTVDRFVVCARCGERVGD